MKNKKKLSVITALTLSALSLTPMSSSARDIFSFINSSDIVQEEIGMCTLIDPKYYSLFNTPSKTGIDNNELAIYIDEGRNNITEIYTVDMAKKFLLPADGVTIAQINEALEQNFEAVPIGPPEDTSYKYPQIEDGIFQYQDSYGSRQDIDGESLYEISYVCGRDKEISSFLKEKGLIKAYKIQTEFYSARYVSFEQILSYKYFKDDATVKEMVDYVRENGIAEPVFYDTDGSRKKVVDNFEDGGYMLLETPEGMTLEEQLDIAMDIKNKFGWGTSGVSPSIGVVPIGGEIVDLYNAIDGDANNDGELDIADATLVLQSIGNADKYSLSAQGAYNADVNGSGDVTALDALEIQKIDAGLS